MQFNIVRCVRNYLSQVLYLIETAGECDVILALQYITSMISTSEEW